MKKIKLLTPILTTACVTTTIVPIVSCSKIEHVTLNSLEEGTQVGTKNGKYCYARYNLSLDNDTYKNGDITCKVVSDNKDLFKVNSTINGYSLTLDVQYWKLELGKVKFTVEFSNGNWTQDINLIMNIAQLEPTMDDYLTRYEKIRNVWLSQEHKKYTTLNLTAGDTCVIKIDGTTVSDVTIKDDDEQENEISFSTVGEYVDSQISYTIKVKDKISMPSSTIPFNISTSWNKTKEELKEYITTTAPSQGVTYKNWLVPEDGSLGGNNWRKNYHLRRYWVYHNLWRYD